MRTLLSTRLLRLLAVFALFTFAGDLAADAIADAYGAHCDGQTSQSSSAPCQDRAPCSHCSCATHAGAIVIGDFLIRVPNDLAPVAGAPCDSGLRPIRLAASIDHPPQLA